MTRLWYVVRREGLTIPFPITMEYSPGENPGAPQRQPSEWLRDHPRFKAAIKPNSSKVPTVVEYAAGESIQRPGGQRFEGFALMLQGRAALVALDGDGHKIELGEMGPGECFGDHITTGAGMNEIGIVAHEDVKIMVFDSAEIHELLNRSPGLAAEIGDAIEARRLASKALRSKKAAC